MRTIIRRSFPLLAVGLAAVVPVAAVTTLGRGKLIGTASARADYDSNIYINSSKVSDTVGTLNADVKYIQDASEVTFEAGAGLTASAFADHDNQNSVDPHATVKLGYNPSEKTVFLSDLTYARNTITNQTLNDRTKSNDFALDASFEQAVSEKFGVRGTFGYTNSDYLTAGYSDLFGYSVGLNAVHSYSPKLKLLAGVTALEQWTTNRPKGRADASSKDWRYTVGAEGELSPKVTGKVSVGLENREFNSVGFSGSNAFYVSSSINWAAAEKTTWSLAASQDLSLTAADQSLKSSSLTIGLQQGLAEKITMDASVGVDHSNYTSSLAGTVRLGNRVDDGFIARARFNYVLTSDVSADVSVGYRNNDSNQATSTYDRFNLGAGLAVRF